MLERLSDYTESRQVMGQQVSNALVYPIVLLVLSFGIVSFLLAYVVPQVVAVFESSNQELPVATRILIGMSDLIRHYWFYALIVIGAVVWGFLRWLKSRRRACASIGSCCACRWWKTDSRPQYRPIFAHFQHFDRQRGAGARGAAHFSRSGDQSADETGRGRGGICGFAKAPPSAGPWPHASCFRP